MVPQAGETGESAGPFRETASDERLRAFARAVGAESHDPAPPTFLTVFRRGEFELLNRLGIPLKQVLHGEQEYEYFAPLHAGDEVEYSTVLANRIEKRGSSGSMTILVFETDVKRAGKSLAVCKSTIIHKAPSPK